MVSYYSLLFTERSHILTICLRRRFMSESRKLLRFTVMGIGLLVLWFGFAGTAFGQTSTGTITGTITDVKGLAMVGVTVLIHNVDTGVDHTPVTTNDQGVYNVSQLQPGNYDVTVSQTGFATVKRAGVAIQVGATARLDVE